MRTKILTLFLSFITSVGTLFAWDYERVQIGDLYYNLDATLQKAEVTFEHQSFDNYSGLTLANIPAYITYDYVTYNVTSIGYDAFLYCSSLTTLTIPTSVTNIGHKAFWGCTVLTSFTIPNSVTNIGNDAFRACCSLTSLTIPASVNSIGYEAFANCSGLTSIIVDAGNTVYDSRNGCNAIIETVSNTLVVGCQNTIIPNSVTSIGDNAFYDCTGLNSITIPNSVTSIGDGAFWGCNSLTSISIPNSVTSIGDNAFLGCTSLTSITVDVGNTVYDSRNGCNAIIETASNTVLVGCQNTIIPNSVTHIGNFAFDDCTSLIAIEIPNSVTHIGNSAFSGCSGLTSVLIPNSVTNIGQSAFYYCWALPSLTIPASVHSIEYQAFANCSGLTSIIVDAGNTVYDSRNGCNAIIEKVSNTLVVGCQNTFIPNSVTSIGDNAFYDCTGLNSITIPNRVMSIGDGAFWGCNSLTSISIPNSVTSIGDNAFFGCTSLTSVTCETITPPTLGGSVFYDVDKSIPLYVPAGSITAYQAADQWSDFTNIQAIPTMAITANEDPLNAGNYYTTFYHGTKRYRLPDNGTEAYVADLSGGELLLTRIARGSQVLPNDVAVIFRAPTSTITLSETSTTGVSFSAENDLRGVDAVTPLEDLGLTRSTCYVLSGNNTDGVGFYQCNSDNLKAHKAYLPYAGGPAGAPKHIRFVFDETEDVGQVQGENVQGTKVLRKGQLIIIRNGVEYNIAGQIVK